jgi:hypothetical protein
LPIVGETPPSWRWLTVAMDLRQVELPLLPSDAHSVIYSFLEWKEKMIFISLSREIYFNSRPYREIEFNRTFSREETLRHLWICTIVGSLMKVFVI